MAKGSQLLTVLCILSIVVLFAAGPSSLPGLVGASPPNSPYSGTGDPTTVYQFARSNNRSGVGNKTSAFTYLGGWLQPGYPGYCLQTQVTNVRRTVDPVPNGGLEQYNEPGNNWTLTSGGAGGLVNSISRTTGGNPNYCLDIRLKYNKVTQTLSTAYVENDFNYTSAIQPDNMTLGFDIKYSGDISQQSWITVKISVVHEGSETIGWSNNTAAYHPTSWEHHSFTTPYATGYFVLRVTIEKNSPSQASINGHVYFDNFQYVIGSKCKPSEVGLTLNGMTVADGEENTGAVSIYASPSQKEETPVSNCWTTSQTFQFASTYTIGFDYSYSMYVKNETAGGPTTGAKTYFIAPVDAVPTWQVNYTCGSSPSGHTDYSYAVYLRTGWTLSSVKNSTGQNYPYSYNTTTQFVKLADITNPAGKIFSVYASALNYVMQVYLQKSTTSSGPWTNLSAGGYFVKDDWLRVMATLRPIGATGNYANVSIFYPDLTLWQSTSSGAPVGVWFHDGNDTLTSKAWQVPEISQSRAGSNWLATVSFNTTTQCGMRQQSFAVAIATRANKISPSSGTRVIWGQSINASVTWQNNDTFAPITDGFARVRYVDRYLQVQYVTMTSNGQGAYATDLPTNLMTPNVYAEFQVELFRYGYANASYALGTHLVFTINLVNDINYEMVRPTQQTGQDQFTGQTSWSQGYTTEVKFYDPFKGQYVLNGSTPWLSVVVNYSRYEKTESGWVGPVTGNFLYNATRRSFYQPDVNYTSSIQQVQYQVTTRVLGAYWEYEQQNFTVIIVIVSHATDFDALRTVIRYPPVGTGNGWVLYDSVSDSYEPHVYWGEALNVTVYYENQSTPPMGITNATVKILIGASPYYLSERGSGYYNYMVDTASLGLGTFNLQVNATLLDHAAQTIVIRLVVSSRATELTKNPPSTIVERPWNDNFVAMFTFLDVVNPASPIPIAGATVNVTGYVNGKYSIQNYMNGSYLVTFQGSVPEATYSVTVQFTYANYLTRSLYFELTIRQIHTECSGEPVTVSVPWGDNVAILLSYTDKDHGFVKISGATLAFTWQNGIQNVDYWIVPNGTYTIFLNTTKVAAGTWSFTISISAAKTHYETTQVMVSFQVRNVLTALYRTSIQPGTSVPWGDNLTIVFTYNDTDHGFAPIEGATITCDWDQYYWIFDEYNATIGGYVLRIRTLSRLEGSYVLHIMVQKAHYQSFSTVEGFVLRPVQTSYLAHPTVYFPTHYWGQNLNLSLEYLDLDHGSASVFYADVTTNWNETYYVIYHYEDGTYGVLFNTTCRGVGSHQIMISLSRTHFANQTVLVSLTLIPVSLVVQVVSDLQVTARYGITVNITIRVTENLYGGTIDGATTTFHWLGGNGTMTPLGAGMYNASFLATDDTGTYVVTIQASRTGYQLGIGYVLLYILPTETKLVLLTSSIETVAGEDFTVSVNFATLEGKPISDANVTYFWATTRNGTFVYMGGGIWNATLDSSGLKSGQYTVYITAGGPNVVEQRQMLQVFLTVFPTELVATPLVQDVYFGNNFTVLVYFHNLYNDSAIPGANITYFWGTETGSLLLNGTAGWYTISLPSTVFPVGTYSLTLQVDKEGFRACLESVLVYIRAQPTHLVLVQAESQFSSDHGPIVIGLAGTYWRVPRGDTLCLYFSFTDNSNETLIGATGVYAWDYGSGVLEYVGGFYVARINLTGISPGFYYPTISLSRQNYQTGYGPLMQLEVILTPTEIVVEPVQATYFTGQVFSLTVTLNDTYHNAAIRGAQLTASILALGRLDIPLVDNGDGTYTLRDISIPAEGTFVISIDAEGGLKYTAAHHEFTVVVTLHPVTRNLASIGALAALIIVIAIAGWLIYARVFAVPWLVRKMRGMARKIGKGETPGLSKADRAKILARPDQLSGMAEPFYDKAGVSMPKAVLYPMAQLDEKASEDEAIWQQLKDLPNLELEQKSQLFAEMKKIPANERVWFVQDLKKQMADGTRFARKTKKPEAPKIAPEIEQEIRARLATFPALAKEEKDRLFRQLSGLPKEEWDAVFIALAESGKIAKPEASKVLPDELPALTEEERTKLLRDLADLSPEEREKVLKTLKAKHAEVKDEGTERKLAKERRKGAEDASKETEDKND